MKKVSPPAVQFLTSEISNAVEKIVASTHGLSKVGQIVNVEVYKDFLYKKTHLTVSYLDGSKEDIMLSEEALHNLSAAFTSTTAKVPKPHKHLHAEAFMKMKYHCEECGQTVWIYNSRDGVTPFSFACTGCPAGFLSHDMGEDQYHPGYIPVPGQLVWVDLTELRAQAGAMRMLLTNGKFSGLTEATALQNPDFLAAYEASWKSMYDDGKRPDLMVQGYVEVL